MVRTIETLDPKKMVSVGQKVCDISGMTGARFHIPSEGSTVGIPYDSTKMTWLRFPPGTVGVPYFHQPPDQSLLTGGVRIRLCSDVARFNEGEDSKLKFGQPWHVHLYGIARRKRWKGLLRMLLKESLVDEQVIADLRKLPFLQGNINFHYELEQPFILDMEHPTIARTFIDRSKIHHFRWNVLWDVFKPYGEGVPYTGKSPKNSDLYLLLKCLFVGCLLVRLELSGPQTLKQGLVLRILDVLAPVQCLRPEHDFLEPPVPGELLMTSTKPKRHPRRREPKPLFYSLTTRQDGKDIAEFAGISFPLTAG